MYKKAYYIGIEEVSVIKSFFMSKNKKPSLVAGKCVKRVFKKWRKTPEGKLIYPTKKGGVLTWLEEVPMCNCEAA